MWTIRKTCLENTPKITELCDDELKETVVIDIFKSFIRDGNKLVRLGTLELYGKFISVLPKKCLSDSILDFFISSVEKCYLKNTTKVKSSIDPDAAYYCAYNFPAVLNFFGAENWEVLKELYFTLEGDFENTTIQNSLASSLPIIANILKNEISEKDLLPVFEKYITLNGKILSK